MRWVGEADANAMPVADSIAVENATVWLRDAPAAFEEVLATSTDDTHKRLMPLVV